MIEDIGGVTSQLVRLALDVAAQRQQVIANNIANAKTPDFSPQRVRFEALLDNAMTRSINHSDDRIAGAQLDKLEERMESGQLIEETDDEDVEMDLEMARLAENVLRYQALLEGLSKRGSVIKLAITEGK